MFIDDNLDFEPLPELSIIEKGLFESQFVKVGLSKNK